jgi:hypothetical protein
MRSALALTLLMLAACDSPSASSLAAYRDAQKSGLARVAEQEKALAQAIAAIRAGQWVPRPDLGACTATLPPPPTEKDHTGVYPAWVMDDSSGWGDLVERVFRSTHESLSVGPSGPIPPPDTQKAVVADTAQFAAVDPRNADDFAILLVDDLHRPKETGPDTFEGGDERGRAWVFSPKKGAIVCAGTFDSRTPQEVLVKFFSRGHEGQVDSDLLMALRRSSIRGAVQGFVAAGPPK